MLPTIGEKLGPGPCGETYAGRLEDGRAVVLEVLHPRFAQRPEVLRQVVDEVRAWIGFAHPQARAPLGLSGTHQRPVVAYEPAVGPTLREVLGARGCLDTATALRVARDLALALGAAHARGLAAGDLRPETARFDPQAGATLTRLGLSQAACLFGGQGAHGLRFGHPTYLAPEALQERLAAPTPACDVYALGVLVFELLTGRPPYAGPPAEVLRHHLQTPLPLPSGAGLTEGVAKWLLRLTAKRPDRRFPDGGAVVEALSALSAPRRAPPAAPASAAAWGRASAAPPLSEAEAARRLDRAAAAPGPLEAADPELTGTLELPAAFRAGPVGLPAAVPAAAGTQPQPAADAGPGAGDPAAAPRIRLGPELGRGSAGTVYEGALWGHDGPVVLKVVTRRFDKYPELQAEILRSVEGAKAVRGPQVLAALELLRGVGGRNVVVFERARGPNLREVLRREGRVEPRRALSWARDVTAALAAGAGAGEAAQSHGDLRPDKVYLDAEDRACLTDFGLARASCLTANFGALGLQFGHPTYLAPEIVQEGHTAPSVAGDAYALGIVLYELLAGAPPFRAATAREVLLLHLTKPPPPPPVAVPRPLVELVLRLTAKDPARRPGTVEALDQALALAAKQLDHATGRTLTVEVEEFSLDESRDAPPSPDGWQAAAAQQAEVTRRWSVDRIGGESGGGGPPGGVPAPPAS